MTTAYGGTVPGDGRIGAELLPYLPLRQTLKDGTAVELDFFREDEYEQGFTLMNQIIVEGQSWPFMHAYDSVDAFRCYFLSHAAFVVRVCDVPEKFTKATDSTIVENASTGTDLGTVDLRKDAILGCFYVKPNFPDRCSGICNGGFITNPMARRRGVAKLMGKLYCRLAKDLGYRGCLFNLVFASNEASLRLWDGLGFTRLACLPQCAELKGIDGFTDAYQYYRNLLEYDYKNEEV
ncbi:hypothetical protein SARC_10871 [Sphaeroforma arctica JP610]|uniref:N-acetyltransferase domain-containing protein n=1 Tax=Sphaeroforma arctica JP610 TaxID=667725 RepID=A0A0L0FJK2_9EUKA|nr:hypothetical protein SARC_10871 [Sphaeroforma arctica JP610]KNC76636.1 hypothetical protein SARC_10871 [Sphaeroforma arctica JP610]|eukprot:XP_014150538.1 hypothetical protein SARC_10871 [Sphaeroforma arctica JP610]